MNVFRKASVVLSFLSTILVSPKLTSSLRNRITYTPTTQRCGWRLSNKCTVAHKVFKVSASAQYKLTERLKWSRLSWSNSEVSDEHLLDDIPTFLRPIAEFAQNRTNGWALTYGDTRPFCERDIVGGLFLSTNIPYFLAASNGLQTSYIAVKFASAMCGLAGLFSIWYHYNQLKFGPKQKEVVTPLLIDTITAIPTIISVLFVIIFLVVGSPKGFSDDDLNLELAVVTGLLSLLSLFASFRFDSGINYMVTHGCWHLFSALTVYLISMIAIIDG